MRKRFFTVLILHHAGPRFRKLRVSYPFVGAALLIAAVVGCAGLVAPRLLQQVQQQSVVLESLEHENQRLRQERDRFESKLAEVSDRLGVYEAEAGRLAEELGVDDLVGVDAAGGGLDAPVLQRHWFDPELDGLQSRTESLDRSFRQLGRAFRERVALLAATPNMMPVEGWFSHGFGWRKDPFDGDREFHRGIDIVAEQNTEIVAPADGVVSKSGRYPDYGNSIDIAHGYGFVTRYAHMSKILVRPGDRVKRGDVIGRVGSTGRSTGPHLHYEVFRDGRRVNPWKYLGRN